MFIYSYQFADVRIDIHFFLEKANKTPFLTYNSGTRRFYRRTLFERGKSAKNPYAVGSAGSCDIGESRFTDIHLFSCFEIGSINLSISHRFLAVLQSDFSSLMVAFAIINSVIFALELARYTPLKTDAKTRFFRDKNSL